jgi:hypothetical protein
VAVGLDELSRIHESAMVACGDGAIRFGDRDAARLKFHLDLAALRELEGKPLEALAATVVAVLRAEAFETGNLRTALLLAAVLLDRSALTPPGDWMRVADGMADLNYGNLEPAVRRMAALLSPDPR